MDDEYYYIKLKSFEYDTPDLFLIEGGFSHSPKGAIVFSPSPKGVRVFDYLDEAIEVKKTIQEGHKSYGYKIEIVRF